MNEVNRIYNEDYVSFEVAKLLKEKGFEQEPDYATSWYANQYYKNSCQGEWFEGEHQIIEDIDDKYNISYLSELGIFIPAPTLQMAMKWLREVHNIFIQISAVLQDQPFGLHYIPSIQDYHAYARHDNFSEYVTYEEAVEAALKYTLENLILI